MADLNASLTRKQLTKLGLIGLSLLILFAAGFAWFWYYVGVLEHGGVDVLMAFLPVCLLPYIVVITGYAGFFTAQFAKGKWQHSWLWGIAGSGLTILLIIGLPMLLEPMFPYQSPAIFVFLAPVVSTLLIVSLISIRRKAAQ